MAGKKRTQVGPAVVKRNSGGGSDGSISHGSPEWMHATLASIGDAVITTDAARPRHLPEPGRRVAHRLDAGRGRRRRPRARLPHRQRRDPPAGREPRRAGLREGVVVGLANHTLLIAKDGTERPIDDSAAPIRDADGDVAGRRAGLPRHQRAQAARAAQSRTPSPTPRTSLPRLREPFVVLDKNLRVKTANRSFYRDLPRLEGGDGGPLRLRPGQRPVGHPPCGTAGRSPADRTIAFDDFEVEHDFPRIGRRPCCSTPAGSPARAARRRS